MTVKVTLRTLIESSRALGSIADLELSGRGAFRVARVIGEINSELKEFENARRTIIEKYVEDPQEEPIKLVGKNKSERDKSAESLNEEMEELLSTEIELNVQRIEQSLLNDVSGLKPSWIVALSWLFEE